VGVVEAALTDATICPPCSTPTLSSGPALPDLRFDVEAELILCDGDQVAAHSLAAGTHTGADVFGAPAKGERVTWTHTDVVRIAGGRIVER